MSAGLRAAGSVFFRSRLIPSGIEHGLWSSMRRKPSFNIFFRDEYDGILEYPLFADSEVEDFASLRLRGGHSDSSNPFIMDELVRRVFINMGQVGSVGNFVSLVVNGELRGYYNPVERMREEFFQEWFNTDADWDVRHIYSWEDGDETAHRDDRDFLVSHDLSILENYEEAITLWDPVNFADYIILNAYIANWDWPYNNWVIAKERSERGIWRFHVWDAEISFGLYDLSPVDWDTFSEQLLIPDKNISLWWLADAPVVYSSFIKSPEFRLLFADRVLKHFYHQGAMTDSRLNSVFNELSDQMSPMIQHLTGQPIEEVWFRNWLPARRQKLFEFMRLHGLWPDVYAPSFNIESSIVEVNTDIEITSFNGEGSVYYTIDGTDPRQPGGQIQGTPVIGSISIDQTLLLRARTLLNGEWSPMREAVYTVLPTARLIITEIHYHPQDDNLGEDLDIEFIEIRNVGDADAQLNGIHFSDGIEFAFSEGDNLAVGDFLVLVSNATAFTQHYPEVDIWGQYGERLANDGERISISDLGHNIIHSVNYNDAGGWPERADGLGFTLVRVDEDSSADPSDPKEWRSSTTLQGSPGLADPLPIVTPVWINEVLSHTDLPQIDAIELYNPNNESVDVSGWWISDDQDNPRMVQLETGSVIPANGYLVIDESKFGPENNPENGFRISSHGENLSIYSADAEGALTGFYHAVSLETAANGVSFGRVLTSTGEERFPALDALSLGTENGPLKVTPVIITEIMYRPVGDGVEYVELWNTTHEKVLLYDQFNPENTWRIEGIGYHFPIGASLDPGQHALIVPIDPADYRMAHSVPSEVAIFGSFNGSLSNDGERLALQWPDTPDLQDDGSVIVPYITMDAVRYNDAYPWPVLADGTGPSLERINPWVFGDDPINWRASSRSGGSPGNLPAPGFAEWNLIYFHPDEIAEGILIAADEDFDGDFVVNLFEYVFDYNPRQRNAAFPIEIDETEIDGEGFLTLSVRLRQPISGITLTIQSTSDLSGNEWYSGHNYVTEGVATEHGNGTVTRQFHCVEPITAGRQQFLRIAVSPD